MKQLTIFVFIVFLGSVDVAADDNWPQWRGPDGTGKTTATASVTTWGPDKNIQWRTELPEAGNSTPTVHGDKVFVTQPLSDSQQRGLLCFDRATGKELWRRGGITTATNFGSAIWEFRNISGDTGLHRFCTNNFAS